MSRALPSTNRRDAFSLVELMVVIGIIAVLLAMLMPALSSVRQHARSVACMNNLRQLMVGVLAFAADHDSALPGCGNDHQQDDPSQRDWLTGGNLSWTTAPSAGTLFPYVGNNAQVYRCPALDADTHTHTGSNGRFDYTFCMSLAGARLGNVRAASSYLWPDGHTTIVATPVIVEEDQWYDVNNLMTSISGSHCETDRLAHTHTGNAHYAAIDGTVATFAEPIPAVGASPDAANRWQSLAPSGRLMELGCGNAIFGWWNQQ